MGVQLIQIILVFMESSGLGGISNFSAEHVCVADLVLAQVHGII